VLDAAIDPGWHIFSIHQTPPPVATSFKLPSGGSFEIISSPKQLESQTAFDPNFEIQTEFYTGKAEFRIPLRALSSA